MSAAHKIKAAALKREIALGIEDLAHGRFQTYSDANIMRLAEDICELGRIRLTKLRLKVAAKVQRKKNSK
jgi:hypothetical protein